MALCVRQTNGAEDTFGARTVEVDDAHGPGSMCNPSAREETDGSLSIVWKGTVLGIYPNGVWASWRKA